MLLGCGGPPVVDEGGGSFQLDTGPMDVPYGTEVQSCFFFEVPSDVPVFVNDISFKQAPGSLLRYRFSHVPFADHGNNGPIQKHLVGGSNCLGEKCPRR